MTASIKPRASRKSLDKLIKYLGKRAKDFKKCFDTSSKWCLKYADLVTREHDPQTMEYAERHHIVPVSYYKAAGFSGHRWHESICSGNIAVLPFGEHLYAHYCAALCARGEMVDKCAHAFWKMYTAQSRGGRKLLPGEREFVKSIPAREAEKIRGMISQVARVEKEGRPHSWDDPVAAIKASQRSYYERNGDLVRDRSKRYREEHPEECRQRGKQWYVDNRDHVREYSKLYREENAGAIKAQRKEYRETHREEIAARKHDDHIRNREKNNARSRKWYREHIDEEHEKARAYRESHKEEIRLRDRAYYANNKEAISERAHRHYLEHREEISEYQRRYREENREKVALGKKKYNAEHREEIAERRHAQYMADPEKYRARARKFSDAKRKAGYRYRKDPATGKHRWVLVEKP